MLHRKIILFISVLKNATNKCDVSDIPIVRFQEQPKFQDLH